MIENRYREKWGAVAHLPRAAAVFDACRTLEVEKKEITRSTVRELVGGGSDRDVAPLITLYKRLGQYAESSTSLTPELVAVVLQSLNAKFEALSELEAARMDQLSAAFSDAATEYQKQIIESEARIDQQETDLAVKNEFIQNKSKELVLFKSQIDSLIEEKQALNSTVNDLHADRAKLQDKMELLQIELLRQAADSKSALTELNARHDADGDRFMTQWGNERGEWRDAKKQYEKQITAFNKEFTVLTSQRDAALMRAEVLSVDNARMRSELDTLQEGVSNLAVQMKDLKRTTSSEKGGLAMIQSTLTALKKEVKALNPRAVQKTPNKTK